jgi:hypothetical protein
MQSYHSVTWVSASLLLVWTAANDYICGMCGRVIQSSGPLRYAIVDGMNVRDSRVHNYPPRWNAAPSLMSSAAACANCRTSCCSAGVLAAAVACKLVSC